MKHTSFQIEWLRPDSSAGSIVQKKELINHCKMQLKSGSQYFTMGSPIYNAIEDGTFTIDLGYGKHQFKIVEISN